MPVAPRKDLSCEGVDWSPLGEGHGDLSNRPPRWTFTLGAYPLQPAGSCREDPWAGCFDASWLPFPPGKDGGDTSKWPLLLALLWSSPAVAAGNSQMQNVAFCLPTPPKASKQHRKGGHSSPGYLPMNGKSQPKSEATSRSYPTYAVHHLVLPVGGRQQRDAPAPLESLRLRQLPSLPIWTCRA